MNEVPDIVTFNGTAEEVAKSIAGDISFGDGGFGWERTVHSSSNPIEVEGSSFVVEFWHFFLPSLSALSRKFRISFKASDFHIVPPFGFDFAHDGHPPESTEYARRSHSRSVSGTPDSRFAIAVYTSRLTFGFMPYLLDCYAETSASPNVILYVLAGIW